MTKKELEKEAEKFLGGWLIDPEIVKLLVDFAEPREKQIQIDAEQIRALQKQNGELTDKVRELEAQNERLNGDLELWESGACRATNLDKCSVVKELKAQIEKMKCCGNCKHYRFQNDAGYYTCIKDGKCNGRNYRSCEFNLEKWEGR